MGERPTIRRALPGDASAVSQFLLATWHDTYDPLIGAKKVAEISSAWHSQDVLRQEIATVDHLFLVAEQDARLCGHAYAYAQEGGVVRLSRLYVLPETQGKGLGKALLNCLEANFPIAQRIELEVHEKQFNAHRFYLANGFTIIGKTAHCGAASDIPALIMERKLKH